MLRIWLSTNRKLNTQRVLQEICTNEKTGQILLVPEQFSHMAEKQLSLQGGAKINRFAEVLSFSRLASRVFSLLGGAAETQTDAAGKLLMMSLAVEQVRSRLKLYATSVDKPAFLLKLIGTIEELRSFCIDAERLKTAAPELGGVLAVKMEELALLMESFDSVCANLGQNPESRLTRLLHKLDGSDFAQGRCIYIDAFSDFNGVEREIIAELLNGGAIITVALHCDSLDSQTQQFASARKAAKELIQIASKMGIETQTAILPEQQRASLDFLRNKLFIGENIEYPSETEELVFVDAGNAVTECRRAAGEILRLVQNGARYRDITVACCDYDTYGPILQTVFRRANIPAYYAGDTDILRQSVVHMLLSALEAAVDGMETQTVLSYLKSGFLRISRERCDRLENYVLLWNIQGSLWEQPWTKDPEGLDGRNEERARALLQELNADRQAHVMPLIHLRDGLRKAQDTAQMLLAFSAFMDEIGLNEQLNVLAKQLFDANELQKAQQYAQVYSIVCRLLEQMYGVLGSSVRTPEGFYQMFRTALSQCSVGTIPAALDSVNVGNLLSQRRSDSDYLFLLGANEGAFPAAQSNRSLLTDHERSSLLNVGINLAPCVTANLERELAAIAGVIETPRKCLYFGGVEKRESYYLLRAKKLFPHAKHCTSERALIERSYRDHLNYLLKNPELIGKDNAVHNEALRLSRKHTLGSLREQTVKQLYGDTLRLSSSKIDKLASCRFGYFLEYGLKAQERKQAKMDPSIFGTFVHDVLEHSCRQVMDEGGFHTVTLQRMMQIAEERMQWYTQEVLADLWQTERAEYLFRRSFAEVRRIVERLWQEMSNSLFEPKWFEMKFGSGEQMPSVKIVGQKMTAYLDGVVDRADVWKDGDRLYVRVVDYKTGKAGFSLEKVLNGIGLQMLLYLFAMRRSGIDLAGQELHCAGVLYFLANVKKVSIDGKYDKKAEAKRLESERRSGMILGSEPVLQAMEPGDNPVLLPSADFYATKEQFERLERFVFQTVAALADELSDGEIEANPFYIDEYTNACGRCSYAEICQERFDRRWIATIKDPAVFWDAIREVK